MVIPRKIAEIKSEKNFANFTQKILRKNSQTLVNLDQAKEGLKSEIIQEAMAQAAVTGWGVLSVKPVALLV